MVGYMIFMPAKAQSAVIVSARVIFKLSLTIVEHGDDESQDEGRSKLTPVVRAKDARRTQLVFGLGERLPKSEEDEQDEADDHGRDDRDIRGRFVLLLSMEVVRMMLLS